MTEKERQRFWSKVQFTANGCWLWTGSTDKDGYGEYRLKEGGRMFKAHHLAYEDLIGPIPSGKCVCHNCDNRACVQPEHFFIGTQTDNHADMCAKGRQPRGETHGNRKLTESEILNIRLLKQQGVPQRAIAKWFHVTESAISNIIKRKRWKHIP